MGKRRASAITVSTNLDLGSKKEREEKDPGAHYRNSLSALGRAIVLSTIMHQGTAPGHF
jgi:hypothetical protein